MWKVEIKAKLHPKVKIINLFKCKYQAENGNVTIISHANKIYTCFIQQTNVFLSQIMCTNYKTLRISYT